MAEKKASGGRAIAPKRRAKPKGLPVQAQALRKMAKDLERISLQLDSQVTQVDRPDPVVMTIILQNFSDRKQAARIFKAYSFALQEYRKRHARTHVLPADLFGEPAWDMLLFLYTQQVRDEQVKVSPLCVASNVPATTALRYIDSLEENKLIEKTRSLTDTRVIYVRLVDSVFEALTDFFEKQSLRS